jgi:hypothetical protein
MLISAANIHYSCMGVLRSNIPQVHVYCYVTSCSLVDTHQCSGGTCSLHHQDKIEGHMEEMVGNVGKGGQELGLTVNQCECKMKRNLWPCEGLHSWIGGVQRKTNGSGVK